MNALNVCPNKDLKGTSEVSHDHPDSIGEQHGTWVHPKHDAHVLIKVAFQREPCVLPYTLMERVG